LVFVQLELEMIKMLTITIDSAFAANVNVLIQVLSLHNILPAEDFYRIYSICYALDSDCVREMRAFEASP
jgi:uncharacterized membrane protein